MSETQPASSSAACSSPSATVTPVPSNPCGETSSSGHQGSVTVTLSTLLDCSQSRNGASGVPQNASAGGDEAKDIPQSSGPCATTEGRTDSSKEPPHSKFCAGKNEGQCFRDRERDRAYPDWSRDKQRHYRDRNRSPERKGDAERHRYRRDYRDQHYHRSYRDRSPHAHSHRDWDSERRRERTSQHTHRDRHHERSHHSHYHRSRDDWGRDRRGHCYDYEDEAHDHWKRKEERRDSLAAKDKSNGRDRDCVASSSALATETSTAAKDSPSRDRPSASGPIANGEDYRYREKYASPESHRSKKHKKSKKKKKSKDKDRHRDSW